MVDFLRDVVAANEAARAHVAELGGLPEITLASTSLMGVIAQTRQQIVDEDPASRYRRDLTDTGREMLGQGVLPAATAAAIELEGEAGLKRTDELAELAAIEGVLSSAFARLVELRAEVIVARTEF